MLTWQKRSLVYRFLLITLKGYALSSRSVSFRMSILSLMISLFTYYSQISGLQTHSLLYLCLRINITLKGYAAFRIVSYGYSLVNLSLPITLKHQGV